MNKMEENKSIKGRICEIQRNIYTIDCKYGNINAKLKGLFYKEHLEVPVIGDYVIFEYNPYGDSIIKKVLERKSSFSRPNRSGHADGYVKTMKKQVLASNFDYVFIITSLNKNYNINRITRYVTATIQGNAKPVVVLTKADLCSNKERYVEEVKGISSQVEVCAISAITGEGMDSLKPYLKKGVSIVLLGSSGVGKSTLLNTIAGHEIMKVSEIRESDSKGHHTTTHRQLFTLPSGVVIIDSPGIRELGMCDMDDGIQDTFTDIVELMKECKYSNCTHHNEPGCAVKKAIEKNKLSEERWNLYCNLMGENIWATRKISARDRKELKKNKRYRSV